MLQEQEQWYSVDKKIYLASKQLGLEVKTDVAVMANVQPAEFLVYKVKCTYEDLLLVKKLSSDGG